MKDKAGLKKQDYDKFIDKIADKYNNAWLTTEINFATASAQNAARWIDFKSEENIIKNLTYQTMGDNVVRYEHQLLNGITKPINDPFWSKYYPPNGWGCRCEAIQALENIEITPNKKIPNVNVTPTFSKNLAKEGKIFPDNNYTKELTKADVSKAILQMPADSSYTTIKLPNGKIQINALCSKDEIAKSLKVADYLLKFDEKAKIKLLPTIEEKDLQYKAKFFSEEYVKKYGLKNADAMYNGKIVEFKMPDKPNATGIQNAISSGIKQSDFTIIVVNEKMTMENAQRIAKGHLNHYEGEKDFTIWLIKDNDKKELFIKKQKS